ncbi:type 1 glutamine amidotransferase family protein [Lignipirellula cremea]|uniref:Beta-galactosidase trimerization domain protein n=1 Tax=Lignipirellula cremea TaxID=2528010 RepID=A0A518DNX2_9BACT|nr:hypothetical protein [Lignipirellula cremea]QDU93538.1 hypothetical protein Pla8534_13180 [Lignipirellula cremea]
MSRLSLPYSLALFPILSLLLSPAAWAQEKDSAARPASPTFFVTRSLTHEQLIPYLKAARPELVQIGNYGAMFHGYVDDPKSTGYPMNLPVAGEQACLAYQRDLNQQVHALGLKVIGHFRLVKAMGDWEEQSGFVEYYNKRWPTDLLGPKPSPHLIDLLQRNAAGEPIQTGRYNHAQLAFCLSSPPAQQMFKQMLKVAIETGVDGVNTNFNYNLGCACPHCQRSFKKWLKEHHSAEEIQAKLGVADLETHTFERLPATIPGYPDAAEATELDWLAARWSAEHFKQQFDAIFIDYGRTLKPDLLVGTWNHLSHVGLKEERAFLPITLWGRGEDFFWYSGGAAFVGKNLNLSEKKAGDAWLSLLYLRELADGKPFIMGKYEPNRMAVTMAEGYAVGGMGMGRYMRFEDPLGFERLAQYTNFRHRLKRLYGNITPYADAGLVLPRQSVLQRHPESLDTFRELGQALLNRQVLLDVIDDEKLEAARLQRYPALILPQVSALSDAQLAMLRDYAAQGGQLLAVGDVGQLDEQGKPRTTGPFAKTTRFDAADLEAAADAIQKRLQQDGASHITSPWTVRTAAYTQPGRVILHLVNFDLEDLPEGQKPVRGPAAEQIRDVQKVPVRLRLPAGTKAARVLLHTPEEEKSTSVPFEMADDHAVFVVPQLHAYAVCEVELAP